MNFLDPLKAFAAKTKVSGRVAIVHWDRESIYFFVVPASSKAVLAKDYGAVSFQAPSTPLEALAVHFQQNSIACSRVILLLSRPELDLLTLNLPPSESDEIPSLVASEVEQQIGDANEPPVVDYLIVNAPTSSPFNKGGEVNNLQVHAFALTMKDLRSLQTQCTTAGFRLQAITSRHLAPLGLLKHTQPDLSDGSLVIAVHLYPGEVEMTICRGAEPILLRSIRISPDSTDRASEQIWTEFQRCLTLLPQAVADLPWSWFVFLSNSLAADFIQSLETRQQQVTGIDPFVAWNTSELPSVIDRVAPFASAANTGAAREFQSQSFSINLLAPKRPPKPANPYSRWIGIGSLAASAIGIVFYLLLSDVWQLQSEVEGLESKLGDANKVTAKFLEKADQVNAVENWLSDQIDWLAELNSLSQRLPDGQNATVRRLNASTLPNGAKIDLSVQVANQEFVSQLETRIRSVKYSPSSKQISQNPESIEYPWQFETTITFPIEAIPRDAYMAPVKNETDPSNVIQDSSIPPSDADQRKDES